MPLTENTINSCIDAVRRAGEIIMQYYQQDVNAVRAKSDHSPVTDADMASHHHLVDALTTITPDISVVSEEAPPPEVAERFWLVDPLDGTKSFINREGEFSVNVGLVENNRPIFGILGLPVTGDIFFGGEGLSAWKINADNDKTAICTNTPEGGVVVVKSVSHPSEKMQGYLDSLDVKEVLGCSSAMKFSIIAEGKADIYPRFGRTMEWDTAAGHAIVNAAGGRVPTQDGNVLHYGKPDYANGGFIVYGTR